MGWKEKEATGEFILRGNVDAWDMVLRKDHKGRFVGKGRVYVGLKKAYDQECVTTLSRSLLPKEVATLRREITKDVLDKVAFILQKMGTPIVYLENIIVKDQESQHGDPKASVERTPEPIILVARNPTPQPITTTSGKNHICYAIYATVLQKSSIKLFLKNKLNICCGFPVARSN